MLHLSEIKGVQAQIDHLKNGNWLDMSLSNGVVRSSKEAMAFKDGGHWTFEIHHLIDDTTTYFSEPAFKEVLKGHRDVWDGDIAPEEA